MPRDEQDMSLKISTFSGLMQDRDFNDIPIFPVCHAWAGKDFQIDNGILRARSGIVAAAPPIPAPTDMPTARYIIRSLHTSPTMEGYQVLFAGVELVDAGGANVGYDLLFYLGAWRSALAKAIHTTNVSLHSETAKTVFFTAAPEKFLNYNYNSILRVIVSNGVDNPLMINMSYVAGLPGLPSGFSSVGFLNRTGWKQINATASTDKFDMFQAGDASWPVNDTLVELIPDYGAGPNGFPEGVSPNTQYQIKNVSGDTFDLWTTTTLPAPEKLLFSGNGKALIRKWADRAADAPIFKDSVIFHERLWGLIPNSNVLHWSDDMNPTNWADSTTAGGLIDTNTWEGDTVQRLVLFADSIVAIKENSGKRIIGATPATSQAVDFFGAVGTIAPDSVALWRDMLLYRTPLGIVTFNGSKTADLLSREVRNIWAPGDDSMILNVVNDTVYAYGDFVDYVTGEEAKRLLVYDLANKSICLYDLGAGELTATLSPYLTTLLNESNSPEFWFAMGNTVYKLPTELPAETAPAFAYITPASDFGKTNAVKTLLRAYVLGSGGTFKITAICDGTAYETTTIELPENPGVVTARIMGKGRMVSLKLESDGDPVEVRDITLMFEADVD
jgi:hypothetical protein